MYHVYYILYSIQLYIYTYYILHTTYALALALTANYSTAAAAAAAAGGIIAAKNEGGGY